MAGIPIATRWRFLHVSGVSEEFLEYVDDLVFIFRSWIRLFLIMITLFWPGCIRGVVGEGMPGYRRPYDKGNLYIKFEIEFPPNNFIPCDKISVSIFGLD